MISTLYIEEEAHNYPLTKTLLSRFSHARHIPIGRFGEVFNSAKQNFRLQKEKPALILAVKHGRRVLPIPDGYSIGREKNYYFSHLLNCPFDCSYCFLQGMYRSAHYVLFVNYEDYMEDIASVSHEAPTTFFSGYDGDSLALESFTSFTQTFFPFFEKLPHAELELRTKSVSIQTLLQQEPLQNVVVAYSLNPHAVAKKYEPKTPSLAARLDALEKLEQHGWRVGLRFDPVLYVENYKAQYAPFFDEVFSRVKNPHSVTLGGFRVPKDLYKKMRKIAPTNLVIAQGSPESEILPFCAAQIRNHIDEERFFPCQSINES